MDMVGAVAPKNLINAGLHTRESMRPSIIGLMHERIVGGIIVTFQAAAQNMHAISSIEARQAGKSEIARGGQMMDRGATGREVEAFWVEMDMAHILSRVSAARREPGRMLA